MQHARGRRRGRVADRRPGMERPDRRDRGESEEHQEPDDPGERLREPRFPELQDVEGVHPGEVIDEQDPHEREDRSGGEEQRQLHGRVFLAVRAEIENEPDPVAFLLPLGIRHVQVALGMAAPHPEEQVHREHGHLVKEVEEEQVQGHEHADRRGGQDEQEDVEFPGAVPDVPGDEHPGEQEDRRRQHQRRPDAVHPEIEGDAELLGPFEALDELEPAFDRVVGIEQVERRHHGNERRPRCNTPDLERLRVGHEEERDRPRKRRKQNDEQGIVAHG